MAFLLRMMKRNLFHKALPLLLAAAGLPAMAAVEPATLFHRTAGDVAFEVTSNGLSRITFQGRALATGAWSVFNAESRFSRAAIKARRHSALSLMPEGL